VLNKTIPGDAVNAILYDQHSGISMGIFTSLPGIVLYTGDFLKNEFVKNQGICLETQFFPDSPNHHQFPSTLLSPGQEYFHHTVLAFNHLT
jgi:aldose 1-epimerase